MTVIVAVSPCIAWVVSRSRTPLGLVGERVAEVIVEGIVRLRVFSGRSVGHHRYRGHLSQRGRPGEHLAEDREAVTELGVQRPGIDEELRIVGVSAAGVGHRELIDARKRQLLHVFIGERSSRLAAGSGSGQRRRAALNDGKRRSAEFAHDAREKLTGGDIVIIVCELGDHLDGIRRQVLKQLEGQAAGEAVRGVTGSVYETPRVQNGPCSIDAAISGLLDVTVKV